MRERAADIERGTVLDGRYQIEDIIGKGGSGVVLRAFDRTAQTLVALKILKAELASDAKWAKRFSRELRLGRPIQHPNVCRIFDIGEADGHRFLTMELAPGGTLRDQLKRGESASRPLPERLADAEAVIAGLAAIHAVGIVHRDFKPDNLLRMEDGRLVLSDFGLATDTATAPGVTVLIGTPHYMAPEVLAGEPATTRSDVWALGVVLHEIFFGRRPERRSTSFDGSRRPPLRPDLPAERAMLDLCERCLSEVPLDRPADGGIAMQLFEAARSSPPSFWWERSRRRLALILAAVGSLALLLGGIALRRRQHLRAETATASKYPGIPRVVPTGQAADWSRLATIVATVPGHVHCFSMTDRKTVRLIWGTPRRAEDVDLPTGIRRPTRLAPETYSIGCPQLSPLGNALLFTAHNGAGATEIRLSSRPDGLNATAITGGVEPLWLGGREEFVYNVDASHAAIFSMPTMSSTLLPDAGIGHQMILEKTVNETGTLVALLLGNDSSESVLVVYDGIALDHPKTFVMPAGHQIEFDTRNDDVLVSRQLSGTTSTLAELDWRTNEFKNIGRYPNLDLVDIRFRDQQGIVVGRHRLKDVWLYDRSGRHRLTSDGENFSAAISPSGDLLISKRSGEGDVSIWWQGRDGTLKQVTKGPTDVAPDFSSDGRSWAYADYARKSIMLCSTVSGDCRVLRHDEMLPTWPRFSPDGENLAYVTLLNVTRLAAISLKDGSIRQLGGTYFQCPPAWSSRSSVWSFEGSPGHYSWSERDATTGTRSGRRAAVNSTPEPADGAECLPPMNTLAGSSVSRRVQVETEENASILRVATGVP